MMKVAQVVTLVSDDGSFGGPVSVARAQTEELARRGHEVTLLAGWDGVAVLEIPGVVVRLHRVRKVVPVPGFSGLAADGLLKDLGRLLHHSDVVHVYLARDLITLSAARKAARRVTVVVQPHGMVMPDGRLIARVLDSVVTRRLLRRAGAVAALTDIERAGLASVAPTGINLIELPNGIGLEPLRRNTGDRSAPTVLFCARLHPRKRVLAFAEMAQRLVESGSRAKFVIAGPDEGDLARLKNYLRMAGLEDRVEYVGALPPEQVRQTLARADVYVLPSDLEPFPMTLLEAMAEGTPSVITTGCMIAPRLAGAGGPIITDGSPTELAAAVTSVLANRAEADRIGLRSRELVSSEFSISAVVDQLEKIYRDAIAAKR